MKKIDLHMHSNCSDDGEFSVKEIMEKCQQANIEIMAITDHNTVRGVAEAIKLGSQMGIQVMAGVELDCIHEGREYHLLGYHFDYTNPIFEAIEQRIIKQEQKAAKVKIELIKKVMGIPLSEAEVMAKTNNDIVTGELIAEVLLSKGDEYDELLPYLPGGNRADSPLINFFWDYFSQGKPAYVPMEFMSMQEGIDLIHSNGGIAVLAHPGQNLKNDLALLPSIIKAGIDGIEAYSSYHNETQIVYFTKIASKNNLLVTCGSDFHGKTKPSIPLGGHQANEKMDIIIYALIQNGVISN